MKHDYRVLVLRSSEDPQVVRVEVMVQQPVGHADRAYFASGRTVAEALRRAAEIIDGIEVAL